MTTASSAAARFARWARSKQYSWRSFIRSIPPREVSSTTAAKSTSIRRQGHGAGIVPILAVGRHKKGTVPFWPRTGPQRTARYHFRRKRFLAATARERRQTAVGSGPVATGMSMVGKGASAAFGRFS